MVRRSKRASLSLSVEAIVILVFAITLLGLGISFIRGIFNQFDIKYDLPLADPTDKEPIVIPPGGELKLSDTGSTLLYVKIKDIGTTDVTIRPDIECDWNGDGDVKDSYEVLSAAEQISGIKTTLKPGEIGQFKTIIKGGTSTLGGSVGTPGNSYACRVVAVDSTVTPAFRVEQPFIGIITS